MIGEWGVCRDDFFVVVPSPVQDDPSFMVDMVDVLPDSLTMA